VTAYAGAGGIPVLLTHNRALPNVLTAHGGAGRSRFFWRQSQALGELTGRDVPGEKLGQDVLLWIGEFRGRLWVYRHALPAFGRG
jgi:hypothetical protein